MRLTAKNWNGFVQGTNTGKITISLSEQGESPKGLLRFMDDSVGVVVYSIEGTSSSEEIIFHGKPTAEVSGVVLGEITINCKLTPEGNIRGEWSSTIGTGGTFIAYPFNDATSSSDEASIPEQIFTKRTQLGFVQLYKNDIINISEAMKREFSGQIIVTFLSHQKAERVNYFNDFIRLDDVISLTYLKFFISEPEKKGINRSITVELRAYGANELIVQGMTESWVLGRSQMMANHLKQYEDRVRNAVNRFFPALQLIILLGMIVWMTLIVSLREKIWLCIMTFITLYGAPRLFGRLFPNAIIKVGEEKPGFLKPIFQRGGNWIIGLGTLIITLITDRYAERVVDSMQAFINALFSSTP